MEATHLVSSQHGFRHIRRGLEAGEALPRCPLLVEQLLAISAHSPEPMMSDEDEDDVEGEREAVAVTADGEEEEEL